jgi:DNA-binding transcriptional ArsR family regulator
VRRAWLVLLATLLTVPASSLAQASNPGPIDPPAAGPGTGLRYAERFQAGEAVEQTTRVVTVGEPANATDARGDEHPAVPVTVQRRSGVRSWPPSGAGRTRTAPRAERVPPSWPVEQTQAVFDDRPCPARGPLTTVDDPGTVPVEALVPPALASPEAASVEGQVRGADAAFHGRPAVWVNATFTVHLPGPLPAEGPGARPGGLVVDGQASTLWAAGLPGPANRTVDLSVHAPRAGGWDRDLGWTVELTGIEAERREDLGPAGRAVDAASGPNWTDRGPEPTGYDVAFPLDQAVDALEACGAGYNAYRLQHPDAFLNRATYRAHAAPNATGPTGKLAPVEGPAWTLGFVGSDGEAYQGGVFETAGVEPAEPAMAGNRPEILNDTAGSLTVWERAADPEDSKAPGPGPERVDALAPAHRVQEHLDRLGFPETSLDRLEYRLHAPKPGAGAAVTIDLAATYEAPPAGVTPETVRALVDGETGRVLALTDATARHDEPLLPSPVPATLGQDRASGSEPTTVDLPAGPSVGAGLATGAALARLLVWALKSLAGGLFTRISREDVLDHPNRRTLFETVREDPGIHLAALIEDSGLGNGATRHHMDKLAEADLVEVVEHGGYVRFFPAGEFTEANARRVATLRAGSNRAVYEAYRDDPDASMREIAERLDLTPSSIHRAVRQLRQVDLVD